jgi:hypothetical protein
MNSQKLKANLELVIGKISNDKNLETDKALLENVLDGLIESNYVSNTNIEDDIEKVIDVLSEQDSYENEEIILCDVLNTLKGVELEDVVE